MKIHISSGVGTGPTKLSAFDAALHYSGVSNYNLVRLSSVVPPGSEIMQHKGQPIPVGDVPGGWGDRLYVVLAEQREHMPNAEAWAGIGWVQDKKTGKGLFVEHEGKSEKAVRSDIRQSLDALMATRNINFGPVHMNVIGGTCTNHPICALVIAVFQASSWDTTEGL